MKANVGRIWEAACKEKHRPVLAHVAFDAEKATLSATNSYIAARVPCEVEDGDESGLIPAIALKEAKGRSLRIADGKATLTLPDGERSWKLLTGHEFPDVDGIFAKYATKVAVPFGVNPRLLHELGLALAPEKDTPVVLHPAHPMHGMLVTDGRNSTQGILMPVRINGEHAGAAVPDVSNDAAVIAGARAAVAALDKRRGKAKAAQAFREAALAAMETPA